MRALSLKGKFCFHLEQSSVRHKMANRMIPRNGPASSVCWAYSFRNHLMNGFDHHRQCLGHGAAALYSRAFSLRLTKMSCDIRAVALRDRVKDRLLTANTRSYYSRKSCIVILPAFDGQLVNNKRAFMAATILCRPQVGWNIQLRQVPPARLQSRSSRRIYSDSSPITIFAYPVKPQLGIAFAVEKSPYPKSLLPVVDGLEASKQVEEICALGSRHPISVESGLKDQAKGSSRCGNKSVKKIAIFNAQPGIFSAPAITEQYASKIGQRRSRGATFPRQSHCSHLNIDRGATQ